MEHIKSVKLAAKWWADCLRNGCKQDNGDAMQSMFATLVASQYKPIDPALADRFERELCDVLSRLLAVRHNPTYGVYLGVDYHPSGELWEAIKMSGLENIPGIETSRFPIKTGMRVHQDYVRLWYGYGAPWQTIYGEYPEEND